MFILQVQIMPKPSEWIPDFQKGDLVIEAKSGVDSVRSLRTVLLNMAYLLGANPSSRGFLVLSDSHLTGTRVREEWMSSQSVLRPDVLERLTVYLLDKERGLGIPKRPDPATLKVIEEVVEKERNKKGNTRTDWGFVILKLLILQWLTSGEPVTSDWLARSAGCSYPAVARALTSLGSLVERGTDRRVRLRWFPKDEFNRMVAVADRARSTVRFVDQSREPRSVEFHIRRLEKLAVPGLAFGGVLGARHYYPDLDLVGVPRLDVSLHCPGSKMDLDFVKRLDPALVPVSDPLAPATLVVHALRHKDPFFSQGTGSVAWADPVECLLDLYEARLEMQAGQFLDHLQHEASAHSSFPA